MNEGDRAIIGLLDIIAVHIDNGDYDKARGVINRTKTTLDGIPRGVGEKWCRICECGFPIDPSNDVYDAGSECICDLKEEEE